MLRVLYRLHWFCVWWFSTLFDSEAFTLTAVCWLSYQCMLWDPAAWCLLKWEPVSLCWQSWLCWNFLHSALHAEIHADIVILVLCFILLHIRNDQSCWCIVAGVPGLWSRICLTEHWPLTRRQLCPLRQGKYTTLGVFSLTVLSAQPQSVLPLFMKTLSSKIQLMRSVVTSIFWYACESWTLTAEFQRRIQAL